MKKTEEKLKSLAKIGVRKEKAAWKNDMNLDEKGLEQKLSLNKAPVDDLYGENKESES